MPPLQLALASIAALSLRLYFVLRFPADAGDSPIYEELARNWLDSHVYGLFFPHDLTPTDIRLPGYPGFLAILYFLIGRRRIIVFIAQALIDAATCYLVAVLAWRVAPEPYQRRTAIAALWVAAICPFLANYSAVVLTEVLATFLTAAALIPLVTACALVDADSAIDAAIHRPTGAAPASSAARTDVRWFLGGLFVGLGTLVRPETPILLAALALVLAVHWHRPRDWRKLVRAAVLTTAGLLLPLLPWGVRNWVRFREVQLLAPRYANTPEEFTPHGLYAWTATWLVRYRDVYLVPWNVGTAPIEISDIPASAFDSEQQRARVAALLEQYNANTTMTPEIDRGFAEIARERTKLHPLRTYVRVPLSRAATFWFTPRVELLPFSGHIWPVRQKWRSDPADVVVTLLLGALNFVYVGLAIVGITRVVLHSRARAPAENGGAQARIHVPLGYVLLFAFIVVRTAFFTTVETPEPRYVLECLPAVFVFCAMAWLPGGTAFSVSRDLP